MSFINLTANRPICRAKLQYLHSFKLIGQS